MNIKPKETRYQGYRFRSRTEARWAVFFNALGVRWIYEPEGYKLPPYHFDKQEWINEQQQHVEDKDMLHLLLAAADGLERMANKHMLYLPDFLLIDFDAWAEVKPKGSLEGYDKMIRLVNQSQKEMLMLRELDGPINVLSPVDPQRNLVTVDEFLPPTGRGNPVAKAIALAHSIQFEA